MKNSSCPNVYEHLDYQYVDLLVETKLKGKDTLIIIHIEPQSSYQKDFNDRMFIYFSQIYEKYRRPIVPIAVFSYEKN
ncbi:RpnC/YadD family protein [Alkalihalobacterium elongatum]|uniref:hypothetical protein n=1 Tax=Alkalihalobacterium elongatum TaxID=2675466 RepID=UPI001C200720|nr:hypothetical protein [Alkalihalobacterium elongatum]